MMIFLQGEAQLFRRIEFLDTLTNIFQNSREPSNGYQFNTFHPQELSHYNNYQLEGNQQSSACGDIWSYQNDQNGQFGVIKILNPDHIKNVLKISLTIKGRLASVSILNLFFASIITYFFISFLGIKNFSHKPFFNSRNITEKSP